MRLALKIPILAVLLVSSAAGAAHAQGGGKPPSRPTGVWVARGEGSCEGRYWNTSFATDTPDPRQCRPGSNGRVALCFDKDAGLKAVGAAPEAVALSKELKRRGWTFVGPTTVYAFMQAMGLVNDHRHSCDAHPLAERARAGFVRP